MKMYKTDIMQIRFLLVSGSITLIYWQCDIDRGIESGK